MKQKKVSLLIAVLAVAMVGILGVGLVVRSFSGSSPKVVVEGNMTFNEAAQPAVEGTLGASPSPDIYQRQYFHNGFQSGGTVYATSSKKSTYTLLNSEVAGDTVLIDWKPINSITLTTMTSSSIQDLLGGVNGDSRAFFLQNSATTTGKNITVSPGAGILLQTTSTQSSVVLTASSTARMTFVRIPYNKIVDGTATTTANTLLLMDVFYPGY